MLLTEIVLEVRDTVVAWWRDKDRLTIRFATTTCAKKFAGKLKRMGIRRRLQTAKQVCIRNEWLEECDKEIAEALYGAKLTEARIKRLIDKALQKLEERKRDLEAAKKWETSEDRES